MVSPILSEDADNVLMLISVGPSPPPEKHFRHLMEDHDNRDFARTLGASDAHGWEGAFHFPRDPVRPALCSAYRCSKYVARRSSTRETRDRRASEAPGSTGQTAITLGKEDPEKRKSAEDMVRAVMVFEDVFPEALASPTVPLMQLDADSLVINELAEALSCACEKQVKVMDMFSQNTCAKVLRFVSEK